MLAGMVLVGATGCNLIIPDISHQPVVHNPFPQLSKVAVAPFFNQSDEPTVDGRKFALAYFAELQAVPGFEVVPLGVVEEAIHRQPDRPVESGRASAGWPTFSSVDAVVIGVGHRLHALLSAALRPARRMVRGEPWLPRNSARLRPAVGHAGGRVHSRAARVRSRDGARQGAAGDANADVRHAAPQAGRCYRCRSRTRRTFLTPPRAPRRHGSATPTAAAPPKATPMHRQRPADDPSASDAKTMRTVQTKQRNYDEELPPVRRAADRCRCRRCNRTRLPPLLRPARSARTARCRPIGPTNAASFRRRRARCARRACRTMVRL